MNKISLCIIALFFTLVVSQEYEQGETVSITCREQEVISVSSVQFKGRRIGHCNPKKDVQYVCNGESSCSFIVDKEFFGESCTNNKAGLVSQYICIPDPCLLFCCANGGHCQLTDPKTDNFEPKCICVKGHCGRNCEKCDLAGSKFPCPWRDRKFDVYDKGEYLLTDFIPANGTMLGTLPIIAVEGSFIIFGTATGDYFCIKIDFNQSSKDSFVARRGIISKKKDLCDVCTINKNVNLLELIAQDSDVTPTQPLDETFCDSPVGCKTDGVECADNGSLDFNEGCPK